MSRKVWIVLVLFGSLGLVAFGVWSGRTQHHINREGFEGLRVGMTEEEVETVLGRPAGEYGTVIIVWFDGYHGYPYPWVWTEPQRWISEDGAISVYFDSGRVVHTEFNEVFVYEESLSDKVRRWMGL